MRRSNAGRRAKAVAALLLASLVAGCSAGQATHAPASIDEVRAADATRATFDEAAAVRAGALMNAFGFELYGKLGDGNAVYSPASVAIALEMARVGARGETAAEMDRVLHTLGSPETLAAVDSLDRSLHEVDSTWDASSDYFTKLRVVNSQFAQRGFTFEPAYLNTLAAAFGSGSHVVDYRRDPEAARIAINRWVAGQTEGRIPELLDQGMVDDMTRLTLVNAVYLKSAWAERFSSEMTRPMAFSRGDGTSIAVPTMSDLQKGASYGAGAGWQAVELPLVGERLAMTIVVPDDLAAFETTLNASEWTAIVGALQPRGVELTLPKFKIETRADLVPQLGAIGMARAFDPNAADFSGMTKAEQLYIAHVVHQANIDVNEWGTEAAAATGVVVEAVSGVADPAKFDVDHPFLFAVRDRQTGAIIFLGRVVDPSAA